MTRGKGRNGHGVIPQPDGFAGVYKRVAIRAPHGAWEWYGPIVPIADRPTWPGNTEAYLESLVTAASAIITPIHGEMAVCQGKTPDELSDTSRMLWTLGALEHDRKPKGEEGDAMTPHPQ